MEDIPKSACTKHLIELEDKNDDEGLHQTKILVRPIDWNVSDCDEITVFFQTIGHVQSVEKYCQGEEPSAIITFENNCCLSKLLQVPSEELVFRNQILQVEKIETNAADHSLSSADNCNLIFEETVPIEILPNELLDYIFTFLTVQERIKSERVCRKWRMIGTTLPWSEPTDLNLVDNWLRWKRLTDATWPLTDTVVSAILSRCGPRLRRLKVSMGMPIKQLLITPQVLATVANCCPNLTDIELQIFKIPVSGECLAVLGESCKRLKEVCVSYQGEKELLLREFLNKCEMLQSLCLSGKIFGPGSCDFSVISKNLKVLCLYSEMTVRSDALDQLMERCQYLREFRLRVTDKNPPSPDILLKLLQHYSYSLEVLEITGYSESALGLINWCQALRKLKRLKELHVDSWGKIRFPCHNKGSECFDIMSNEIRIFHAHASRNMYFDETFVKKLLERNDGIVELHLLCCSNLSPIVLKICHKYSKSMREFALVGTVNSCKTSNWCELLELLCNLESLRLNYSGSEINDEVVRTVARNCRKLKSLDVEAASITDVGLEAISTLPRLTEVNISYLENITDKGIGYLAHQGMLERLDVSSSGFCISADSAESKITDESCSLIPRFCPNFRELTVQNLVNISNKLVDCFSENIELGFLKNYVTLFVEGTSITMDYKHHKRLFVHVF